MLKDAKLTPAEWEIMEAIWRIGGAPSVREVIDAAFQNGEKAYTTIQTIMNILVKKGMLTHEKIGLVNFYKPARKRQDIINAELAHLAKRVFRGSIPAMANYLIHMKDLSRDEIESIKKTIEEKESHVREKDND
jgi:BlaI family transcriptional regulator, penicillinase repressor